MSDLFDPLRDLTREPVSSAPPSEVRRRGDRQRRRRTAVQALGGAAAVAVIAVGAVAVADRSPSSTREVPPATQNPSPTVTTGPTPTETGAPTQAGPVTRMPDGFPLEDGMLDLDTVEGPSRQVNWLTEATICGDVASYSPADVQTDSVGVNHTAYESGGTQRRALMVYPDSDTAHRMARDLVGKFEACPRYPSDTGDSAVGEATNEVTPRDAGDEAWTIKTGNLYDGAPNIGQTVYVVVRVGNAVVYQMFSTEGPGLTRPGFFEKTAMAEVGAMQGTIDAMCVFSDGGC